MGWFKKKNFSSGGEGSKIYGTLIKMLVSTY